MSEPIEYNYMIKLREFIKTGEEIQKIGFSENPDVNDPTITERFNQYPKGSLPIMCAIVNNAKKLENLIVKVFKEKFIQRLDIGREYFEGNIDQMVIEFTLLMENWGNSIITLTPITLEQFQERQYKSKQLKKQHRKDERLKIKQNEKIKDQQIKERYIKDREIKDKQLKNIDSKHT
jgi:hypothetical protein